MDNIPEKYLPLVLTLSNVILQIEEEAGGVELPDLQDVAKMQNLVDRKNKALLNIKHQINAGIRQVLEDASDGLGSALDPQTESFVKDGVIKPSSAVDFCKHLRARLNARHAPPNVKELEEGGTLLVFIKDQKLSCRNFAVSEDKLQHAVLVVSKADSGDSLSVKRVIVLSEDPLTSSSQKVSSVQTGLQTMLQEVGVNPSMFCIKGSALVKALGTSVIASLEKLCEDEGVDFEIAAARYVLSRLFPKDIANAQPRSDEWDTSFSMMTMLRS